MSTLQTTFLKHPDAAGNQITFTSGGDVNFDNGAVYLDSTNNRLGIGTSSPTDPLTVACDSSAQGIAIKGRAADGIGEFSFFGSDGTTQLGRIQARTGFLYISSQSNTGGAGITIDSSSRVGIGVTAPAKHLHIEDTSSDVTLRIGRNGYVQTDLIGSTGAGANDFKITQNGFDRFVIEYGSNSAARIDSSGRLLVGTSSGRGPQIQLTEALGLQQAAMRTYSGTGDLTINLSGLRQVSGSAHRQAGGVIIYSGIQGNASNSTSIVCFFRVNGLNTYVDLNVVDIVGTANLTLSNAGTSSCTLTLDVGDSVEGSAVVILTSQSGGHLS